MIRIGLSVLTITVVSALYSANGLKTSETIDFNLPDRVTRQLVTNGNLLNTSITNSSDRSNRFADLHEITLQRVERLQNLLDLEQRVNAHAIDSSA